MIDASSTQNYETRFQHEKVLALKLYIQNYQKMSPLNITNIILVFIWNVEITSCILQKLSDQLKTTLLKLNDNEM